MPVHDLRYVGVYVGDLFCLTAINLRSTFFYICLKRVPLHHIVFELVSKLVLKVGRKRAQVFKRLL